MGLAKALASGGRLESVVQQELQLGEGGGLEAGDSVEVKYTGWLMTNNTFGQVGCSCQYLLSLMTKEMIMLNLSNFMGYEMIVQVH